MYRRTIRLQDEIPSELSFIEMFNPDLDLLIKADDSGIIFYISGNTQPVFIKQKTIIRLGRATQDFEPTVDLTSYHGIALGVSRYHADIVRRGDAYFIKDMGSTNGTWINNERIPSYKQMSLNTGDTIRLGYLAIIVRIIKANA